MQTNTYRFKALWTLVELSIFEQNGEGLSAHVAEMVEYIEGFESEFSRFRKNSDLSMLNREHERSMSPRFLDLLEKSIRLFRLTDGYFNPLSDIRTYGYTLNFDDAAFEIDGKIRPDIDMDAILVQGPNVQLRSSMYLDFAAIAKGYISDLVAIELENRGYRNFSVNFGGDIVVRGNGIYGNGVMVGLTNPSGDGYVGSARLVNASMSTSGSYIRSWTASDGKQHHHLKNPMDPNAQESSIVSMSVIHPHGYASDALSTALFVMGESRAFAFAEREELDIAIVRSDGGIRMTDGFGAVFTLAGN